MFGRRFPKEQAPQKKNSNAEFSDICRCIFMGDVANLEAHLKNNGNPNLLHQNKSLLYWTVHQNKEECCKVVLDYGGKFSSASEMRESLRFACEHGLTNIALMILQRLEISTSDIVSFICQALITFQEQTAIEITNKYNVVGAEILKCAIRNHLHKFIEVILSKGVQYKPYNIEDDPLQIAVLEKDVFTTQMIISNRAYFRYPDKMSNPIHTACSMGLDALVEILLTSNISINYLDNNGDTPLYLACLKGRAKIAQMLLRNGAMPNISFISPLSASCEEGHIEVVNVFIEERQDLNAQKKKDTPLICAVRNGHKEIAKLLLEKGADPNRIGAESNTYPLIEAIIKRDVESIKLLISYGANINQIQFAKVEKMLDEIPLTYAISMKWYDLIEFLIEGGANTNLVLNNNSPLIAAILSEDIDIVNYIIEHGGLPNMRTANMKYPLIEGISKGNIEIVNALLKNGADPNFPLEQSPIYTAISKENIDMVKILIDYGADVNALCFQSETPLVIAIKKNDSDIVKLLINSGAQLYLEAGMNKKPFDYALEVGNRSVISLILKAKFTVNIRQFNDALKKDCNIAYDIISEASSRNLAYYFDCINDEGSRLVKRSNFYNLFQKAIVLGMKIVFTAELKNFADNDMLLLYLENGGKVTNEFRPLKNVFRYLNFSAIDTSYDSESSYPMNSQWILRKESTKTTFEKRSGAFGTKTPFGVKVNSGTKSVWASCRRK